MASVCHRLMGAVLAIPYAYVLADTGHPLLAFCAVSGTVAVAGVPDLDRFVPKLPTEGVTHTVWFGFLVGMVLGVGGKWVADSVVLYTGTEGSVAQVMPSGLAILGFMIGLQAVIGHLLTDFLTGTDVRPLRPFASAGGSMEGRRLLDPRENEGVYVIGTIAVATVLTAIVMLSL